MPETDVPGSGTGKSSTSKLQFPLATGVLLMQDHWFKFTKPSALRGPKLFPNFARRNKLECQNCPFSMVLKTYYLTWINKLFRWTPRLVRKAKTLENSKHETELSGQQLDKSPRILFLTNASRINIHVGYTLCLVRLQNGAECYQSTCWTTQVSIEGVHVFIELNRLVYNSNSISKLVLSTYNKWNFVPHSVVQLLFQRHKATWSYYRLATCVNINLKFEMLERTRYLSRDTYTYSTL